MTEETKAAATSSEGPASAVEAPAMVTLDALDLSALLCSKVCHDVISPVGAIVNGLEMLEDEKDPAMREMTLDLVKRSSNTASSRLQFCRIAYGAAGSAGAAIDTGDAEKMARGVIEDDKTKLVWNGARVLLAKNKVKVLLNICQMAAAAIPRGGVVEASIEGAEETTTLTAKATGTYLRLAKHVTELLAGRPESGTVDAHGIQAYYAGLVARASGMDVQVTQGEGVVTIVAKPVAQDAAKESEAQV
jgi:histidine phosphotransferase ChpT